MTDPTLQLTCELIERPSVTPDDTGCQQLIGQRLAKAGFEITNLRFDDVDNLWAVHGSDGPTLAFLGHTDVVPPGPNDAWNTEPFTPTVIDGQLFGRGAADMKGSVAAMVVALERFVEQHPAHHGRVALLLTSDEEGDAINGIRKVMPALAERGESIDYCLVGEPSSKQALGDLIRIGRRGSLTGQLNVTGVPGHVAYPEQCDNPAHKLGAAIAALSNEHWDDGNIDFPPTSFQIFELATDTAVSNMVPGQVRVGFNFRFSPASTAADLQQRVTQLLCEQGIENEIEWFLSGNPFHTVATDLADAVTSAVQKHTERTPIRSTGGGTSDGRFVAPTGAQVVELGPINATIHKPNECVVIDDLQQLTLIYADVMERLLKS